MNKLTGAALIGQSGGPTAAINATLAGAVQAALEEELGGGCITKLYGMRNGIEGFLNGRTVDLSERFIKDGRGRARASRADPRSRPRKLSKEAARSEVRSRLFQESHRAFP